MNLKITLLMVALMSFSSFAQTRVRRVAVQGDQIVTVRTSTGIATIIQVPDRPNSVVVGDQDAFRVEYLDQAITIKPLSLGAKSNLYIYTDWKRFNVELISGSEAVADYVVYLDNPKASTAKLDSGITWTDFKNKLKNESIQVDVKRVGRARNGILLVEFDVHSTVDEPFRPEWIWLSQNGDTKPIHNLFLASLEIGPRKPISGVMQLREIDLNSNEPLRFELRRKRISYLTIQKVNSWKR